MAPLPILLTLITTLHPRGPQSAKAMFRSEGPAQLLGKYRSASVFTPDTTKRAVPPFINERKFYEQVMPGLIGVLNKWTTSSWLQTSELDAVMLSITADVQPRVVSKQPYAWTCQIDRDGDMTGRKFSSEFQRSISRKSTEFAVIGGHQPFAPGSDPDH
jgi:hypothetical protein